MSRAMVEGLFGVHPDALAGTLTISPGFPQAWTHARLSHPDLGINFVRDGREDTWEITQAGQRFQTLTLRIPAAFTGVAEVQVSGHGAEWRSDPDAVGRSVLEIVTKAGASTLVQIHWAGDKVSAEGIASAKPGKADREFRRVSLGSFEWWAAMPKRARVEVSAGNPFDWLAPRRASALESVDLTGVFNDQVTAIFAPGKYLSPRSAGVSLALPWQGTGAWAGHVTTLPVIDDSGLRKVAADHDGRLMMPDGVFFATPSAHDAKNIVFTSQWDNYPKEVTIPINGHAKQAYFLMAGSTSFMQSRIDNGEVVVKYADGSVSRLALRNPETWWPIEQDYFIDDYQFPLESSLPPRVDLMTGKIRLLNVATFKGKGREVPGGAATVLNLALDPSKEMRSLTLRTLTNNVVIGLMSATLERP